MTLALERADDDLWRCTELGQPIAPKAHAAVRDCLDELRRRPPATLAARPGG
jgi:hypothetical protein